MLLIFRRFLAAIFTLLLVSVLIFVATEVAPGDVATALLGRDGTPEQYAYVRAQLGLDRPALARYLEWLRMVLQGDLGVSLTREEPIAPIIALRLRNTLVLALTTLLLSVPLALGLGILAGLLRDRWPDLLISTLTLIGMSLPGYVVAILLILGLSLRLSLLPAVTLVEPGAPWWQLLPYVLLPALTLTTGSMAYIIRLVRTNVIDVMTSDYVQMATLKGVPRVRVVLYHALPSALLPAINAIALMLAGLLGGVVMVESIFNYPGVGRLMLSAVKDRDLPLVQALALVGATLYIVLNLTADLLMLALNPRLQGVRG
jgi:peptide/nickel transport system permease protein